MSYFYLLLVPPVQRDPRSRWTLVSDTEGKRVVEGDVLVHILERGFRGMLLLSSMLSLAAC